MPSQPRFNYIITIHNKADLIGGVLDGILVAAGANSAIYPVLDGCTDNTEAVIDAWSKKHSKLPVKKVFMNDVHELLSINAGLKAAKHTGEGYNIILQDDVVLQDSLLEKKVATLYQQLGPKLGYISFRLGANLTADALTSKSSVPLTDYVENAYGHGLPDAVALLPGQFCYRDIPIKSPVCIPFRLIREVGRYEERLAPYAHDDVDYAIRCLKAGFKNGVFNAKFESKIEWGGTRQKTHPRMNAIITRNMNAIRSWFPKEIAKMSKEKAAPAPIEILGTSSAVERKKAEVIWKENQRVLEEFQQQDKRPLERVSELVKNSWRRKKAGGENSAKTARSLGGLATRVRALAAPSAKRWQARKQPNLTTDLSFTEAVRRFPKPNELYAYMHHYFHRLLPSPIQAHRRYFSRDQRGFGEDAFHAMWWLLLREYQPKNCLEIGVYRGQVISLWSLVAKYLNYPAAVTGVSPFTPAGDSVSKYLRSINYLQDVKKSFKHFSLPTPDLTKALSTTPTGQNAIAAKRWDLIYIDGNHDFEIVLADYELAKKYLAPGGILVFDDAALKTSYNPPSFSTGGHPGPSRVAQEYARQELLFLGAVGHNLVFQKAR